MTLTTAILINVLLDIAILGVLAFAMSRTAKLKQHGRADQPAAFADQPAPFGDADGAFPGRAAGRRERIAARLRPVLD